MPTATATLTRTATSRPVGTNTPKPTPTLSVQFVPPSQVDAPPRALKIVNPIYPDRALKERIRGLVILRVVVAEEGDPVRISVEKGAREDLTRAAIAAAQQWRFEPAQKNGRPVRTFVTLRFPFEGVQFARTPVEGGGALTSPPPSATPTPTPVRGEEPWRQRSPRSH